MNSFEYWMPHSAQAPNAVYGMPTQQGAIYDLPPGLSKSLSGSPQSCTYDQLPSQLPQEYYPQIVDEPAMQYGTYQHMPMTPSEFGSDHDTGYCSPPPQLSQQIDPMYAQITASAAPQERQHTTSGRRRAQNRAAQRAFRERKEKHARDLEIQLAALTEKHNKLKSSYANLSSDFEKLRKTIELLTQDDEDEEGESEKGSRSKSRRGSSNDTLTRKLLDILHGEITKVGVKSELAIH